MHLGGATREAGLEQRPHLEPAAIDAARSADLAARRVEVKRRKRLRLAEPEEPRCTRDGARRETELQFALDRHDGRWGGRWDSNPQQQGSQPWTLPLSYGHHCKA